jgi:hypothetical protein
MSDTSTVSRNTIVIEVRGGCVVAVYESRLGAAEILIMDYDADGTEPQPFPAEDIAEFVNTKRRVYEMGGAI